MPRLREFRYDRWAERTTQAALSSGAAVLAIDTETTGVGYYDQPFAATVTWHTRDGGMQSGYYDLESEGYAHRIKALRTLLLAIPTWVGHNLKFDLQKLQLIGAIDWEDIERTELHDTQTIYHLLDENGRKGLKHLAVTVLGVKDVIQVPIKTGPNKGEMRTYPKDEYRLAEARRKLKLRKEDGYHLLPRSLVIPYALRDTEFTLALYDALMPRLLAKKDDALLDLYRAEIDLTRALLRMEADGFRIDMECLDRTTSEFGVAVMEGWQKIVALTGNHDWNPNSVDQVKARFAERGVILEDTQAKTLKALDDELATALVHYREVSRIYTTYLRGLQREQRDGLAHPSFNATGARTGRMSSGSAQE